MLNPTFTFSTQQLTMVLLFMFFKYLIKIFFPSLFDSAKQQVVRAFAKCLKLSRKSPILWTDFLLQKKFRCMARNEIDVSSSSPPQNSLLSKNLLLVLANIYCKYNSVHTVDNVELILELAHPLVFQAHLAILILLFC